MKTTVRRLSDSGLQQFADWLARGEASLPPKHLLTSPEFSGDFEQELAIDLSQSFSTTFELGKYLHEVVFAGTSNPRALFQDTGMWSWISLAYIECLVSKKDRGQKSKGVPLAPIHYIQLAGQASKRHGYKLIARSAWWMARTHGDAAAFVLGSPDSPWGEIAEAVIGRQQLASHKGFISLASTLYLQSDGTIKRGAAGKRPKSARKNPRAKAGLGSMRRLALTLNQFGRTFNTRVMPPQAMLSLLPKEYERWQDQAS